MLPTPPETKPQVRAADLESPALGPLGLKLVSGRAGLDRPIEWPRVQKPGLAIAGFLPYVRARRVQILGESEFDYLKTLSPRVVKERFDAFTALGNVVRHRHEGDPAAGRPQALLPGEGRPALRDAPPHEHRHRGPHGFPRGVARAPRDAPRRPRRGRRARHPAPGRLGSRKERVRAGPRPARPPPRRRRPGRRQAVPQRRPRRILGRRHPPPHGAAGPGHRQRPAPLRGGGGPRAAHRRARHPACATGSRGSSTTGSASTRRPRRSSALPSPR